ncbi:hypothetical protein AB7M63_004698 [Bradyrhizobium japonicum]|nr:hypothetical protein BJS_00471 [Bradyrhizobium japonicum SEMIA 5079]
MKCTYLAISIAVGAYILTTGVGAAIFPFSFGRDQLMAYVGHEPNIISGATLGSLTYWMLLLVFVIALPTAALLAGGLIDRPIFSEESKVPIWLPIATALAMTAYCLYRLSLSGGLNLLTAPWDLTSCYEAKILRRAELQSALGNFYFAFAFASLPMLSCYLLARGVIGKNKPALLSFAVLSVVILSLDLATMQKAPAFIYLLMVGLTLALSEFGILRSGILVLPIAATLFLVLSITQFCAAEHVVSPAPFAEGSRPEGTRPDRLSTFRIIAIRMVRSNLLRMAVGFPFYVEIFSDPERRCGIDPSWLRRVFGEQRCFPPTLIFPKVFPNVTSTTGYQPAPVNVSGYAEAGPWYALFATFVAGSLLGLISSLGRGRDPAAIATTVAACVFAYYIAQSSLTGALFDAYGLLWLTLPLFILKLSNISHGT